MTWPNQGVTFDVDDGLVTWSILRLLALLADFVVPLRWSSDNIDVAPSPQADRVEDWLIQQLPLDGPQLLSTFSGDPQVIEGALVGVHPDSKVIDLVIKAVDGMHWEIYASNESLIQEVERWSTSSRRLSF